LDECEHITVWREHLYRLPDGRWITHVGIPGREYVEVTTEYVIGCHEVYSVPPPVELTTPPPEPAAETAPPCPVVLRGPDDPPIVRGVEKSILTPAQYRVVEVLVNAFPERLPGDSLARKSEVGDPVGVIDRLSPDKDWGTVLSKPGQAHGGYGIVAKPRKTR